jgi:shikimate dehydrogenase
MVALARARIARVTNFNRTRERSRQLASEFQKKFRRTEFRAVESRTELTREIKAADILVNATSLGLKPKDVLPIETSCIPRAREHRLLVCDLIYRPRRTRFLRAAKRRGQKTMNGESMLIYQGARAFEIWTGKKAPLRVMRKALRDALLDR